MLSSLSAAAAKMTGMLGISSARGGVTHCLPRSVGRSAVVIGTAAPGILVLTARIPRSRPAVRCLRGDRGCRK